MSDKPIRIDFDVTPMGHMRAASNWTFVVPKDGLYQFGGWEEQLHFIQEWLALLTDEQRRDVLRPWCASRGGTVPCQCWNDE